MLQLNKKLNDEINGFKYWLKRTYHLEKLSKKLDKYNKLSFDDFLVELKKIKQILNQEKRKSLLKRNLKKDKKIDSLLLQIKETDNAIDQMVNDLYGLTPEEIKIIEANV